MRKTLEKELRNLPRNFVVLSIFPSKHYDDLNMHLLNILVNQNRFNGAYLAINKPYHSLIEKLKDKNIDHNKIFFIDCVSRKESKVDNCVFIKSAQSLTNIGISLDPLYKSKDHSFVFVDSLDALSIYHDTDKVIKFGRSLISLAREHNTHGIMLGLSEMTDKRVIDELSMVCDRVIDLTR